ncbi:MAG: hypothetical protein A2Y10_16975 [Planctomycetes bacterium GWF2_41_51]|nr:MAG: hypothetical protein A2Y10_16975 [Planctomycetes bacterium GWF2_41_51]HBG28076.1 hypothetical protein [Phycisphaerales bacterium]
MKKNAFTLIELLVVLAVIAALIAILIPALGTARQTAYKLFCLNNLKQLGITVHSYTQGYKVYPVCVIDANVTWPEFLANPDIAKNKMLGVPVSLWPYHKEKNLYDCPMLKRKEALISYCYDSRAGREIPSASSGYASLVPLFTPPGSTEKPKKNYEVLVPDRVKSPKTFIILYDLPLVPQPGDANLYKNIDPDDSITESFIDPNEQGFLFNYKGQHVNGPHTKAFNILFADGHVKSYKKWKASEMTRNPN